MAACEMRTPQGTHSSQHLIPETFCQHDVPLSHHSETALDIPTVTYRDKTMGTLENTVTVWLHLSSKMKGPAETRHETPKG